MYKNTYLNNHIFRKIVNQGIALAFTKALVHFTKGKWHDKFFVKKIELVKKRISRDRLDLSCATIERRTYEDTIWVCWLQGEENMPEIVKLCCDSVKKHAGRHEVVLLTLTNFRKWVTISDIYYEQFRKGQMLPSQFADVLRINLLSQRGGLWLDATIYVLNDIPDWYFSRTFYSIKMLPDEYEVSNNRWTGYCLGCGKEDVVFSKIALFFDKYVELHDEWIDYLLLDYAIDYIFENYPDVRKVISSLPMNNLNSLELLPHLCDIYDEKVFSKYTHDTVFFKLRYRAYEFDVANLKNEKDNVYCHLRELVYGKVE